MSTPRLVLLMLIVNIAVVLGGVFVNYKMIKSASLAPAAAASDKEAAKEDATEEEQESAEYLFVPVEKIIGKNTQMVVRVEEMMEPETCRAP